MDKNEKMECRRCENRMMVDLRFPMQFPVLHSSKGKPSKSKERAVAEGREKVPARR